MSFKGDDKRFLFEHEANGDELQVTIREDRGLHIEIDEPWAGSTDTGFGATTRITLNQESAQALASWLATNYLRALTP